MLDAVRVPPEMEAIFSKAQEFVGRYFRQKSEQPSKGTIEVFGQRYILVRAASMSVEFFEMIRSLYKDKGEQEALSVARSLLFDIAHAIGFADARNFHARLKVEDPIERLSTGPLHFSHSGWAFVNIFPESRPSPDENCYLIYDHPFSFESDSWIKADKKTDFPVCIMNAGYSSGWCEASFGVPLVSSEILCKAKGDDHCRFIMAPPARIKEHIGRYLEREPELARRVTRYEIPGFFSRKKVEDELREREEQYRSIFESAGDIFLIVHPKGVIEEVNPAACKTFGWSRDEFKGRAFSGLFHTGRSDLFARFRKAVEQSGQFLEETFAARKDGFTFDVEIRGSSFTSHGRPRLLAVVRDISDRKRIERETLKVSKLESVGTLAGGIAHDFNNFLTSIIGNVSLAKLNLPEGTEQRRYLASAERASISAKDLTQQLLAFARGGAPVKQLSDLEPIIRDSFAFALHGSKSRCKFGFPTPLWPVEVDPGQFRQVMHNLALNASESMPSGGDLCISASNVDLREGAAGGLKPGPFVQITVEDQGTGIAPNHLGRVFDPYFSTKQRGSGLGLATSYSIVRNHGGHIEVESELGKRTRFTLYFPAKPGKRVRRKQERPAMAEGGGRILFMDDEGDIRQLAKDMLTLLGYTVTCARDGREAVRLYRKGIKNGSSFDVVILDLTVPGGMGGGEAIRDLLALDPQARVLVSSGYSKDPILANYREFGFTGIVSKPYDLQQLSRAIKDAMHRPKRKKTRRPRRKKK